MISFFLFSSILTGNQVEVYSKPMVRLNGAVEILELDESELKDHIVGMKEGEVRILTIGSKTVEVEILKADATYDIHTASANEDATLENLF